LVGVTDMATLAQIEAARRNGARSRGPITPEGKQAASLNSLKHGLTARKVFVLSNESEEAFKSLHDMYLTELQPATLIEHEICTEITHASWRIRRLAVIETALFDKAMREQSSELAGTYHHIDEPTRQAHAFEKLMGPNGTLRELTHYATRLERSVTRLLNRLRSLQRERMEAALDEAPKTENEPETEPAPRPEPDNPFRIEPVANAYPDPALPGLNPRLVPTDCLFLPPNS
ncbi:MAG TPA: hypothetical protein VEQ63_13610, partial [Bryobacteraceae bacterium]|nr:hypothetical protein [Bryobacteraceae bacterium]